MQPLERPAPPKEGHRYWSVDLNVDEADASLYKGPHLFKAPRFSVMLKLRDAYAEAGLPELMEGQQVKLRHVGEAEEILGAYIGACWASRTWELESALPGRDAGPEAWLAYGAAVQEELQDVKGFTPTLIHLIGTHCLIEVEGRIRALTEASERADFSLDRETRPSPASDVEGAVRAETEVGTLARSGTS